ncbi:MAG TPA: GNAT family N-acetyltransferase [Candidatus Dormibacteraeota bacterium]|nr:GNAT family N-acetyltransferase [Candidatus Dormibacteraeota bacterium]
MSSAPPAPDATVVLKDGSTVAVGPVQAGDEQALTAFYAGLSAQSQAFRFFAAPDNVSDIAKRLVISSYESQFGLVARTGGEIVGHAVYVVTGGRRAEMGLAVADAFQGRGLGLLLFAQLADAAARSGIEVFEAVVKADNHRMLDLLKDSGFPLTLRSEPGEIHAELPTELSEEAEMHFERRHARAAQAAVGRFLAPRSVAVVGTSFEADTPEGVVLHNLLAGGFTGALHLVNGTGAPVDGRPAYTSVRDIPGEVDMAVIVTPANIAVEVAGECAVKGVHALVVISPGFAESGAAGAELQRRLLDVCRRAGMRLVGPNCSGVLNSSPAVRLNASVITGLPAAGKIGFLSQSGSLGTAIIELARAQGTGFSSFVSAGNNADISGSDLLQYWEGDPATNLVMLYLESFGDPRRFSRIARRVARTMPILAVKGGRSAAGARAASTSHSSSLVRPSTIRVATSSVSEDALFQQAGIIRIATMAELFGTAQLLGEQPLPSGDRVGIITNASGPGVLCADSCEFRGLRVPPLADEEKAALAGIVPSTAVVQNPVVLLAQAGANEYARAITALASLNAIDSVIVIYTPQVGTRAAEIAEGIHRAAASLPRPVPLLAVFMSAPDALGLLHGDPPHVPTYPFPEDAARALGHAHRYVAWRNAPSEPPPQLSGVDAHRAAAIISATLAQGPGWLQPAAVDALLQCYGLAPAESMLVSSPRDAGAAAKKMGGKVVLKGMVAGLVRKSDAGAVRVDLEGAHEVEAAAKEITQRLAAGGQTVLAFMVQRMAPPGVEMLVGVVQDRHFGPVVAVGATGRAMELVKDTQARLTPLGRTDAAGMIRSLVTYPLLDGYRGAPAVDVGALEDVLVRVAALADAHSEIADIDLNPVIVHPGGAAIVDARIRVEAPAPRQLWQAR